MDVGDELDVKILGPCGAYGLAKVANFIVYVREGVLGDLLKVRVVDVNNNVVYAEILGAYEKPKRNVSRDDDENNHSYPDEVMDQFYMDK
jgi:predicted RNA-binding protein with TRAM domain